MTADGQPVKATNVEIKLQCTPNSKDHFNQDIVVQFISQSDTYSPIIWTGNVCIGQEKQLRDKGQMQKKLYKDTQFGYIVIQHYTNHNNIFCVILS